MPATEYPDPDKNPVNPQPEDSDAASSKPAKQQGSAPQAAADLIRQKIKNLYGREPSAAAEAVEAREVVKRSKHQQFIYELTNSGKSLAQIQTEWHAYYAGLPENEKHEVWREFYAANSQPVSPVEEKVDQKPAEDSPTAAQVSIIEPYLEEAADLEPKKTVKKSAKGSSQHAESKAKPSANKSKAKTKSTTKSVADIKKQLLGKVKTRRKLQAKQHFQSLIFGLGVGAFVILVLLFGFFNERFIAPFITPSRHVSSTPIIIDPNSAAVSPNPEVLIPKINVEIPVVYDQTSIDEAAMETSLEHGVVHYATTAYPGQQGNAVFFGHSSNNIFNPGQYKFAFVLLNRLEIGDLFYLTKDGKQYVYRVYKREIVDPSDVAVLGPADKPDTATLITCDPPGTSLHRLVVNGEQITPDPAANTASTALTNLAPPKTLPSNSPSLWQRFIHWF